jgi:hypothetical protein
LNGSIHRLPDGAAALGARLGRRGPEVVAAWLGLLWFLFGLGGLRTVAPTSLDWLAFGDYPQHLLGWLFFRESPWSLPVGRVVGFLWPAGTTVGFTDSNPLVAVLLRPFSTFLPRDFQFIGAWLALCYALQGWFGARLAALASSRALHRILGGAFFALSPVLLFRLGHDALCAHFALLALLQMGLGAVPGPEGRRAARGALATAVVLTLVHPYLAAMADLLAGAVVWRLCREGALTARDAWRLAGWALLGQLVLLLSFGYLTGGTLDAGEFGVYSADLLAFVNPAGMSPEGLSRFLPALCRGPGQYEGYAYLGAGGLLLLAAAALLLWRRGATEALPRKRFGPLLLVCLAMAVFALSSRVTALGEEVLDLRRIYTPLEPLVETFRASGRFIWPLYYLAIAAAALVVLRAGARRPGLASLALAAAVALQAADLSGADPFHEHPWRLPSPAWRLAAGHYDRLYLYPPQVSPPVEACGARDHPSPDRWTAFAYQAYAMGAAFNSGRVARADPGALAEGCRDLVAQVHARRLLPRTLYVVEAAQLPLFSRAGAVCGKIDGYDVCVSADDASPFREHLARAVDDSSGGADADGRQAVTRLTRHVFGRDPTPDEMAYGLDLWRRSPAACREGARRLEAGSPPARCRPETSASGGLPAVGFARAAAP